MIRAFFLLLFLGENLYSPIASAHSVKNNTDISLINARAFLAASAERIALKGFAKLFSLTADDIAKYGVKTVVARISAQQGLSLPYGVIDYGCEGIWAGISDGVDTIAHHLVRYALADTCYKQLCRGAYYCGFDYPQSIRNTISLYLLIRFLEPIIVRQLLGVCLDAMVDYWWYEDELEIVFDPGSDGEDDLSFKRCAHECE